MSINDYQVTVGLAFAVMAVLGYFFIKVPTKRKRK